MNILVYYSIYSLTIVKHLDTTVFLNLTGKININDGVTYLSSAFYSSANSILPLHLL